MNHNLVFKSRNFSPILIHVSLVILSPTNGNVIPIVTVYFLAVHDQKRFLPNKFSLFVPIKQQTFDEI